jgi:hypothetical protein
MEKYKDIQKIQEFFSKPIEEINTVDTITVDIPLFIRLLEYSREDAKDDMDLHNVAEKALQLGVSGKTLTMSDYDSLVGKNIDSLKEMVNKYLKEKKIKKLQ